MKLALIYLGWIASVVAVVFLAGFVWSDRFKRMLESLPSGFILWRQKLNPTFSRDTRLWYWFVTVFQISCYGMITFDAYNLSQWAFRLFELAVAEIFGFFGWHSPAANFSWVFSLVLSAYVLLQVMAKTYKWFTLYVPQYMAAITVNQISGERRKYKAGSYRKMPWEAEDYSLYFSMELISVDIPARFPTQNGGVATNTISVRYKPNFEMLDTYAQVDEVTVATGMADGAKIIATRIIGTTPTRAVTSKLQEIRDAVDAEYGPKNTDPLEKSFGIDFDSIGFSDLVFSKETQETLDTMFSTESLLDAHKGNPAMRNDILALQTKGKVNKDIKEIKLDFSEGVSKELGALLKFLFDRFGWGKEQKGGTP